MIDLYSQIINNYPDVPLAQESYWRLIEVFFTDLNYFPDSRMARTAKKRMAEIKGKKNKSNQKHLLTGGLT